MAQELIMLFNDASEEDEVGAIVVTGTGKAFCAGMDLSVEGNVFGLNESLSPSINQIQDDYNELEMVHGVRDTGGRVSLAIYECKKPVIGAINGAAVGVGATMTSAWIFDLSHQEQKLGSCLENRYHPGGLLDVVLAKDSRYATCAGVDLFSGSFIA